MEQKHLSEKKRFSLVARIKSITHAWRGINILFSTSPIKLHLFFTILAVYLGFLLNISSIEWLILIITICIVLIAEAFNTAIEIDIDLTSPNYHPYARDTKDVAAAAVLISVVLSAIVGLIIFLPKIF